MSGGMMGDVIDMADVTTDDYAAYVAEATANGIAIVLKHMEAIAGKAGQSEALRDLLHLLIAHNCDVNDLLHDELDGVVFTPDFGPDDA